MKVSWIDEKNKRITVIYWSNGLNLEDIERYGKECDYIQVWYPQNLEDEIHEKYCELISYIEVEASWKGYAYSAWTNLQQSADDILQAFSKNRRYEVRRAAQRDNLLVEFLPNPNKQEVAAYETYYNRFASQTQELGKMVVGKVYALCDSGHFVLARVSDGMGKILAVHGYIVDGEKQIAALFSSSSFFRNDRESSALISRANVYLHYQSMLYFKQKGFQIYDFGGVYLGKDNPHFQSISFFKRSLGGEIITFQNGFVIPISEARKIEYNLGEAIGRFEKADIVLWGYSCFGRYAERRLKECFSKSCKYIIDNKLCKTNTKCVSEQILDELDMDQICILVCTDADKYNNIVCQKNVERFAKGNKIIHLRGEEKYVGKI